MFLLGIRFIIHIHLFIILFFRIVIFNDPCSKSFFFFFIAFHQHIPFLFLVFFIHHLFVLGIHFAHFAVILFFILALPFPLLVADWSSAGSSSDDIVDRNRTLRRRKAASKLSIYHPDVV